MSLEPVLALVGAACGFAADRIGARWPAHEDGSVRAIDWRTPVVIVVGAGAFALLPGRFVGDSVALAAFGAFFVAIVLLLATDLDQRLLPDVVTLPLIPLALLFALSGRNPLLGGELSFGLPGAVAVAILLPGLLWLGSLPFGAEAIGIGDVKLLVSVGLLLGFGRALQGTLSGAIVMAVVVVALLAVRRITLRSYIPMGPFLIVGAMWGVLAPPI